MITNQDKKFYEENGYVVARGLFGAPEVAELREHFMRLREIGSHPGDMVADTQLKNASDPLRKFPRMIHMHRWDEVSLRWLIDARLNEWLSGLLGGEPLAVQSMLYFKPPGARGQAVHQDNFYLRAQPGTCMAAWLALDDCDESNGCIRVVPGSHTWPILCPSKADSAASFTDVTVPLPEGVEPQPVIMRAGDVLFFNGSLVHGSYPNATKDRFRRSLIGHYIEGRAERVTEFDQPVLRMDGSALQIEKSAGGGACGVWVEEDGTPVIELSGAMSGAAHE